MAEKPPFSNEEDLAHLPRRVAEEILGDRARQQEKAIGSRDWARRKEKPFAEIPIQRRATGA